MEVQSGWAPAASQLLKLAVALEGHACSPGVPRVLQGWNRLSWYEQLGAAASRVAAPWQFPTADPAACLAHAVCPDVYTAQAFAVSLQLLPPGVQTALMDCLPLSHPGQRALIGPCRAGARAPGGLHAWLGLLTDLWDWDA
jgi:hypothetical protein